MATASAEMSTIQNIPYEIPPKGQSSNFINPESRGPAIVVVCYISVLLMWPILLLRLYCKAFVIRKARWDDLSAVLAAIGGTALAAEAIWLVEKHISGPHAWDVRAMNFMQVAVSKVVSTEAIVYSLTINFAKLALFILYYRLFAINHKTRIAIYLGAGLNTIFYIASVVIILVYCTPRRGETYLSTSFATRCKSPTFFGVAQGIFGLISDLYIYLLPLPVLWRLQMAFRKKLGITAIFLTGSIAILASSLGLYYRVRESTGKDFTWVQCPAAGLAVVEIAVGIICASIPHLPALFRHYASNILHMARFLSGLLPSRKCRPRKSSDLPFTEGNHAKPDRKRPGGRHEPRLETQLLGTIQGEGQFIKSNQMPVEWRDQSLAISQVGAAVTRDLTPTRHGVSTTPVGEIPPSETPSASTLNTKGSETTAIEGSVDNNSTPRKGYWDIMSIFRSGNSRSRIESASHPRSRSTQV